MTWTEFYDMHSGGSQKEPQHFIFIELPEAIAITYFEQRFGHHPLHVTCQCCGADYSLHENETLEAASGYERGCKYDESIENWVDKPDDSLYAPNPYQTMKQFRQRDDVLNIPADEILGRKDK